MSEELVLSSRDSSKLGSTSSAVGNAVCISVQGRMHVHNIMYMYITVVVSVIILSSGYTN